MALPFQLQTILNYETCIYCRLLVWCPKLERIPPWDLSRLCWLESRETCVCSQKYQQHKMVGKKFPLMESTDTDLHVGVALNCARQQGFFQLKFFFFRWKEPFISLGHVGQNARNGLIGIAPSGMKQERNMFIFNCVVRVWCNLSRPFIATFHWTGMGFLCVLSRQFPHFIHGATRTRQISQIFLKLRSPCKTSRKTRAGERASLLISKT